MRNRVFNKYIIPSPYIHKAMEDLLIGRWGVRKAYCGVWMRKPWSFAPPFFNLMNRYFIQRE